MHRDRKRKVVGIDSARQGERSRIMGARTVCRFQLQVRLAVEAPSLREFATTEEVSALSLHFYRAVLQDPEALRRLCRLALVTHLSHAGREFESYFDGAEYEEILSCLRGGLPSRDERYWKLLRQNDQERLALRLDPVFESFHSTVTGVEVQDYEPVKASTS